MAAGKGTMKNILLIILAVLMVGAMVTPVEAQEYRDPNQDVLWNWYSQTPANNKAYRGKTDTLPQVPLSGVRDLSVIIACTDTMKSTLYFDYMQVGRTTWTQGYVDSIISEKDTVLEIPLRTSTLNRLPSFAAAYRMRAAHHAIAPEGTPSDYDSTSTYTQKWIWNR